MPLADKFANWAGQSPQPKQNEPGNNGTPPTNTQTNSGTNTQNNLPTNDALIDDIWKASKTQSQSGNDPAQQNDPSNPQPAAKTTADLQKTVKDYLQTLDLGDLTISEADIERLKSGEGFQDLASNLNGRIQNSFLNAVGEVNKLLNKKLPQMVEEAVNKSRQVYEGGELRKRLNEQMPFTRDAAVGPVAESVLRRFLEKPDTSEAQAMDLTKRFFQRVGGMVSEHFPNGDVNTNTREGFRGAPRVSSETKNWLDVLKG